MVKLRAQTERIGYPILGVVSQINALCRDKLGEYGHWGATTQDITDTATVLQIREGLALVDADLAAISDALADLARSTADTPIIGRSNLQQAIPITFGYKMAGLLAAIERHRERLAQLKPRVLVGEFGGASGTLASIETGAMETQAGLMEELGLGQPRHRLAHRARQHRRGGRLPRPRRRHARQDQHGRQADDADRSRRGLRAVRARPRLEQHDAAEAQPDLALLHPRRRSRSCASTRLR